MLKDRLRRMILGGPARPGPSGEGLASAGPQASDVSPAPQGFGGERGEGLYSRHSHGLEQFFAHIEGSSGLSILDFSGVTQANVSFITDLGHRLYSEDFLRSLSDALGESVEDPAGGLLSPDQTARFIQRNLDFPDGSFDGVLAWDVLEFLPAPLLKETVDRLFRIMKPGCYLLTFFHAEEKNASVPAYSYRIASSGELMLAPVGQRRPVQIFNNRAIEKLFQDFQSVKFFLARDQLREVIVLR